MLQPPPNSQTDSSQSSTPAQIQLLLFVDERPISQQNMQQVQEFLQNVQSDYSHDLQVIDIQEQPHLVEYYRLIVTPALVKIMPAPRQILAGSNLVQQLDKWWSRWQFSLKKLMNHTSELTIEEHPHWTEVSCSDEVMRLTDDIFRLKQEKEELKRQIQFKDQILAMLAHDLRSPLTAASIALETLELAYNQPDKEKATQLIEQLSQQARKQFRIMNRLISDILQASKSLNVDFQVDFRKLYLQPLFEEVISQFREQFHNKQQLLKVDLPQDVPPIYGDDELIRQVLVNLLENAVKYTPEQGQVTVSILHRTTQKVQVSVCDTGPGIPEEKQEGIFNPHVRLRRDSGQEGYGIGLSVCRKIIQAHYGTIWVESWVDHGSCFHFTLPIYR